MNWIPLCDDQQLDQILSNNEKPSVIFKHSTRCSISATALDRMERQWKPEWIEKADFYYLDLLTYRSISNRIAEELQVEHQSPQVLVIDSGKAVYEASHMGIVPKLILESLPA